MSTIGYSSWAVDLKDVGAVYPFQGWETAMVILAVILWLGWHVIQTKAESAELEKRAKELDKEGAGRSIDTY